MLYEYSCTLFVRRARKMRTTFLTPTVQWIISFRLEGTSNVNMPLVLKFIKNYFFVIITCPELGVGNVAKDDSNIFKKTLGGLKEVKFDEYKKAYETVEIPNVKVFSAVIDSFVELMIKAAPDEKMANNMDYMLNIGEMFTTIVYARLGSLRRKIKKFMRVLSIKVYQGLQ